MVIQKIITISWLVFLSVEDIRKKKVSTILLVFGFFVAAYALAKNEACWTVKLWAAGKAIIPGGILLLIAYGTKKAGIADGIVLLWLGILEGYQNCIFIVIAGLMTIAVVSGALLAFKKVRRDTEIPFLPFLTWGWILINGAKLLG